jgi:hypothetical protein
MERWGMGVVALAAVLGASSASADIAPRNVEVMMSAVVRQASGGGIIRRSRTDQRPAEQRPFTLAELPGFPFQPGAGFILLWRASGAGLQEFFDEDGAILCQPYQFAGLSAGPASSECSNGEAIAQLLGSSFPFHDRLPGQLMARGPSLYLASYSLELSYVPSTFWSTACCAFQYRWDDNAFERQDGPGLFQGTDQPHFALGEFVGSSGWLDYRFDIAGDQPGVSGTGRALIQFDVSWRFRNYTTTGVPAPAGLALLALGSAALALARARR